MAEGRLGVVAALLVSVVTLAACTEKDVGPDTPSIPEPVAEPSVAVEEAQQTYGPLVSAVVDAVAGISVPGRPDADDAEVIYYDREFSSCVFVSLRYEFDTVFGAPDIVGEPDSVVLEGPSWDDVRAATEEVLGPEGFELTDQLDIPGGSTGFDAATDDGTRLEVRSKIGDPSSISLDAPVQGGCDLDSNETLPPLPS
ncbi:MAG: hypothetical protein WKF79_09915 [Nocardioides sp.]